MADGELTLRLTDSVMRRLRAAADETGQSVEAYATAVIAEALDRYDDVAEDVRIAEECERTGISYSVEESMAHFRDELSAQVAKAR